MFDSARRLLRRLRARRPGPGSFLEELGDEDRSLIEQVRPYTMTGPVRVHALVQAVRYLVRSGVPGAFAECGVWRGGSVLAMVLALLEADRRDRDLYLYDTFEGMTRPTDLDVSDFDIPALEQWNRSKRPGAQAWPRWFNEETFNLELVERLLADTGYPQARIHFVKGKVEDTIPQVLPDELALLRLDTDWYESTRHELEHLYPKLARGGVLIIDDYGHWKGSQRAVDEYFARPDVSPILLNRVDYSCRLGLKV